jgi:hypothetical protein
LINSPNSYLAFSMFSAWLRTKAQSSFDSRITKDYEREEVGKTPKQIKDSRRGKLRGYVAICMLGLGTMHWGGAEKVLEHMNQGTGDKELANICGTYLICSCINLHILLFVRSK